MSLRVWYESNLTSAHNSLSTITDAACRRSPFSRFIKSDPNFRNHYSTVLFLIVSSANVMLEQFEHIKKKYPYVTYVHVLSIR